MRKTLVAALAAMFFCAGSLGCKTASKMAWWKSADNTGVESTVLAHSAPALPADVARQAESFAASEPSVQMVAPGIAASGGQAAPYTPPAATVAAASVPPAMAAPAASYPSTGASPYASTKGSATKGSAVASAMLAAALPSHQADLSADLGSVENMPYNPNAVPPARTVASAPPTTPNRTADRYGLASTGSAYSGPSAPPVKTAALPQFNGGDRYGNLSNTIKSQASTVDKNLAVAASAVASASKSAPRYAAPSSPATAGLAPPTANIVEANVEVDHSAGGGRYGVAPGIATTVPSVPSVAMHALVTPTPITAPITPTAMASASPYRPGGTGSYQGSANGPASVAIATRPKTVESEVPNVATPSQTPGTSPSPRYR